MYTHTQNPIAIQRAKPQYCDEMILPSIFSLFCKKGALCIVKAYRTRIYTYNLIIYNQNINILLQIIKYIYINILDNLFYFVLSFYDFIYMLFTVYIYTAQHYIAIRDTRKVYLLTEG